jgi:hypothetical protein
MTKRQQLEAAFASSWRHGLVLLFFVLLPLATTWPLAAHLGTHVPGEVAGDNLSTLWSFWWMRQAIASNELEFWRTTFLFHPGGVDLVQHTHTALNALIGATVLGGVSEITALNVVLLGALTLAGFGTYLIAWDITGHRGASIVAGVFFCAAPFFAARLLGHFNFVSAWGLPFFAWIWLRALRADAAAAAVHAIAAGLVLAAVAYTDYYYVAYLLLFMVCVLALRRGRIHWMRRAAPIVWTWIDTALVALLAIVIALHFAIVITGGFTLDAAGARISMRNGLNVRTVAWVLALVVAWRRVRLRPRVAGFPAGVRGRSFARDLGITVGTLLISFVAMFPLIARSVEILKRGGYVELDKRWHSAPTGIDPLAVLFGNPFHPLYGAASRALYALNDTDHLERVAWFGVVPLVILIAWRRHWLARDAPGRFDAGLWIAIAAVFGVWALGPYLRVAGTNTGLWLPASLVQYVSILSNARLPSRAIVMVYLSVAVLVGIAIAARAKVTGRPLRPGMVPAIAAFILIDFAAQPIALYRIDRPALFEQFAAMPPGAVCVLPLGLRDGLGEVGRFEHRALADQVVHGKPIVGGFIARLPKSVFEQHAQAPVIGSLLRLSSGEAVDDAALARDREAIARDGVPFRYIVIYPKDTAPALRAYIRSMLPVRHIASQSGASQNGTSQNGAGENGIELYEVTGGAAR